MFEYSKTHHCLRNNFLSFFHILTLEFDLCKTLNTYGDKEINYFFETLVIKDHFDI